MLPTEPRVLIGIPCGDRLCTDTKSDMDALREFSGNLVATRMEAKGTYLSSTHNTLVDLARFRTEVTHLLFTDSDMRVPADGLVELLKHDLDIVGCSYQERLRRKFMNFRLPGMSGPPQDLEEWAAIPSGFMLVKMRVFRKLSWPWFYETYGKSPREFTGTDINFCHKARAGGFKVFCDLKLSQHVRHIADTELEYRWDDETRVLNPMIPCGG